MDSPSSHNDNMPWWIDGIHFVMELHRSSVDDVLTPVGVDVRYCYTIENPEFVLRDVSYGFANASIDTLEDFAYFLKFKISFEGTVEDDLVDRLRELNSNMDLFFKIIMTAPRLLQGFSDDPVDCDIRIEEPLLPILLKRALRALGGKK